MSTTDIESFYVLRYLWIESEVEVGDVTTPLSDMEDGIDESDKSTGFQVEIMEMCELVRCKSYEVDHGLYLVDFSIYNLEGKHSCHHLTTQMGLVTGTLFTLYTVYIYAASTWRLLQVYKHYQGEHKVTIIIWFIIYI